MTGRFFGAVVRHRLLILLIAAGLTAFLASGLTQLEIDTSDDLFLPSNDAELDRYAQSVRLFGDDRFLIAVLDVQDFYTPDTMALVARITDSVGRLETVRWVTSPTHEEVYFSEGQGLQTHQLQDNLPSTPEEAASIRKHLEHDRYFVNNMVSADGRHVAIAVRTWPHIRAQGLDYLVHRMKQVIHMTGRHIPVHFAGNHIQTIEMYHAARRDLMALLPVCAAVMMILLGLVFHSARAVVLPMAVGAVTLVWVFGALGLAGIPMQINDVIVPILVMTFAAAYTMHVLSRHWKIREDNPEMPQDECVRATMSDTFLPLFMAQLTTMIGLLALTVTDIPAIRQFGVLGGLGTLAITVLVFTFVPACLALWRSRVRRVAVETALMRRMERFSRGCHLRWRPVLFWTILLTLIAAAGIGRLRVENDPKTFFPEHTPLRRAFNLMEERMGGALMISVVFDASRPGALKDPRLLRAIESLQAHAAEQPEVLKTVSFVDKIKRLNRAMHDNDPAHESVPATPDMLSQLLLLGTFGSDPSSFDRYIDYDYRRGRLEIRVKNAGSEKILALADDLQQYMSQNWPSDLTGYVTGDYYMACRASAAILRGQLYGYALAGIAVFLVMWFFFHSAQIGLLTMIPNVSPVLAVLGLMGYAGVKLDVTTALLATVAFGLVVDDTIHFIVHYMRNLNVHPDGASAVEESVRGVGRAMVISSIALALGFSVLLFSTFVPVSLFGLFMLVAVLLALLYDFALMPALLGWKPLVGIWDLWSIRFRSDPREGIPLFKDLKETDIRKIITLGRRRTLLQGQTLMREGEMGEEMFVILDGTVSVRKSGKTVAALGRGQTVGEMGVVRHHTRSADVVADEDVTVFAVGSAALDRIQRRYPRLAVRLLHNLAAILSDRLADTTDRVFK